MQEGQPNQPPEQGAGLGRGRNSGRQEAEQRQDLGHEQGWQVGEPGTQWPMGKMARRGEKMVERLTRPCRL